ncbi:MAG: hypothetical protein AB1779_03120 [Candidatus Thermoplasmatota archaeon]
MKEASGFYAIDVIPRSISFFFVMLVVPRLILVYKVVYKINRYKQLGVAMGVIICDDSIVTPTKIANEVSNFGSHAQHTTIVLNSFKSDFLSIAQTKLLYFTHNMMGVGYKIARFTRNFIGVLFYRCKNSRLRPRPFFNFSLISQTSSFPVQVSELLILYCLGNSSLLYCLLYIGDTK